MTRAAVGFALMLTGIALGLINIAMLEAKPVNDGLPLVASLSARPSTPTGARGATKSPSDFPVCVTVRTEPLLRTPHGRLDCQLGKPSNDRGET